MVLYDEAVGRKEKGYGSHANHLLQLPGHVIPQARPTCLAIRKGVVFALQIEKVSHSWCKSSPGAVVPCEVVRLGVAVKLSQACPDSASTSVGWRRPCF